MSEKTCSQCRQEKPIDEFVKNKARPDGHANCCRDCMSKFQHSYYLNNRTKTDEKNKAYARKYPDRVAKAVKKWADSNRTYIREKAIEVNYGLSSDEFYELLFSQGQSCSICSREIGINCAVDHCHLTGVVRGLLCKTCNSGIGFLGDNPKLLSRALEYITT